MAERARNHTKFASLLNPMPDLEKVQAAKDVAVTLATPGWAVIEHLLEVRRAQLLDELVFHVPMRTQAEFAGVLAEVRGIDVALDAGRTVLHVGELSAKRLSESERAS